MKKFNFHKSKQKYYKNIKTLLYKLNFEVESTKEDKNDKTDTSNREEEVFSKFSEKLNLNDSGSNNNKDLQEVFLTDSDLNILCKFCNKNKNKYTCPKCKIKYCSVDCYKSHNLECTEDFYKRNVIEEMKSTKENEKDSTKFRSKLKEMYERLEIDKENNSSSKEKFLSEERQKHLKMILKKLENETFDFSSDLTPSDWKEFQNFLNGFIENQKNQFALWMPFWLSKIEKKFEPCLEVYDDNFKKEKDQELVKKIKDFEINQFVEFYTNKKKEKNLHEIDDLEKFESESNSDSNSDSELELENLLDLDNDEIYQNYSDNSSKSRLNFIEIKSKNIKVKIDRNLICKSILLKFQEIPSLQNLSKLQPSDSNILTLIYILCNILFLFKLYNGEVNENLEEIIEFLINNCKILYDKDKKFVEYDLNLTLNEFFSMFNKEGEVKHFKSIKEMVLNDLLCVSRNKFYIFEALIRLYEMLHRFIVILSGSKSSHRIIRNLNEKLIRSKNKIIYFMSYVKCLCKEKLDELVENLNYIIKRN